MIEHRNIIRAFAIANGVNITKELLADLICELYPGFDRLSLMITIKLMAIGNEIKIAN